MIKDLIEVARGRKKANLLLKNARVVDVFNCTIEEMNIAISSGIFVGPGEYEAEEVLDLNGKIVAPGFIDGHVHIESS
ncbi:MAG: adenine deaminase, partial [Candidatus Neomarinimicrobiota bacterium]